MGLLDISPCRGQRRDGDQRRGTKGRGDPVDRAREKAWVYWSARKCLPCVTLFITDGCVLLIYKRSWKFHQLAAGQLLSEQPVRYGKVSRSVRPVHRVQNHACLATFLQPARRAAVLDQPSSLRPHWIELKLEGIKEGIIQRDRG